MDQNSAELLRVPVENGTVEVIRFGSGAPMVLLPGLSLLSLTSAAQAIAGAYGAVAQIRSVYLIPPRIDAVDGVTIPALADEAASVMAYLGIAKADVVGVSLGGVIAQQLAVSRPECVRFLALVSTVLSVPSQSKPIFSLWKSLAEQGDAENLSRDFVKRLYTPETVAKIGEGCVIPNSAVTEGAFRNFTAKTDAILAYPGPVRADAHAVPTAVFAGTADAVWGYAPMMALAQAYGARVYAFPGGAHAFYDESSDFVPTLKQWLETAL